jgi:predicted kinase
MNKIKPIAYMLIGVPGAGKSTWATRLVDFMHVSTDAYIEAVAASMGKTYGEVFKENIDVATRTMNECVQKFTKDKTNIIWDQTNLSMASRRKKLNVLLAAGYDVTAVAFEIPTAELARRRAEREAKTGKSIPATICESMGNSYQRPTRLEGFAKVIIVTPEGEIEGG